MRALSSVRLCVGCVRRLMICIMCVCKYIGVTVLLSLTVFLLLVAETMPPTSDAVPLIGQHTQTVAYKLSQARSQDC